MNTIHPTALIHPEAKLGVNVSVGPFAIIDADVQIGDNSEIHSHAVIRNGARIGNNCRIFNGAVISEIPQDLKYANEVTHTFIGDGTTVREYATIHRGTEDSRKTVVGKNCLIMAYVHIAHDCTIGDYCIFSNATQIAGHVTVEDWASLGGMVAVHQFVTIGAHSFIGGHYRVAKDVPPFILALGEPLRFGGLNMVGLRRRGFSDQTIEQLKQAYRIIFRSQFNYGDAVNHLENTMDLSPEIKQIVTFIRGSERGIL